MIQVECDLSEEWDSRTDWPGLARRSVLSAIGHSRHPGLAERDVELSVRFTSDAEVEGLNHQWRGKKKPTNVLSFPMAEEDELDSPAPFLLGDIVLAYGVCAAEAADKAIGIEDHAAHLVVHGTLHLLGYDHETSEADADLMEKVECEALAALGIADPYLIREVSF